MSDHAAALHLDAFEKNKGFAPPVEAEENQPAYCATGAAGDIDSPRTNHRYRSFAPARLRWRRRPFCQGPCTLGPSFAGLCARCVRNRNRS